MHYPPESAAVMLILRIYALVHQAIDKKAIIAEFQQVSNAYEKINILFVTSVDLK